MIDISKTLKGNFVLFSFFVMVCLALLSGCAKKEIESFGVDPIIGVKIYDHKGKLPPLFKEWRELGINAVFASESLNSNPEFRSLAEKHKIARFVILPIFYDPEALDMNPDLYALTDQGERAVDDWVHFVCPSREDFRREKIKYIKNIIRKLYPNGLSIDFIRHFVFWEKVYPERTLNSMANTCFDKFCLERFQIDTGISIPDTVSSTSEIANWIKENHLYTWVEWKCGLITSMIKTISDEAKKTNPDIVINVHAVPWRQDDFGGAVKIVAGQDFSQISPHADFLSPMTYAHMVKRSPYWVNSVVEDMDKVAGCRILPSIQVKETYLSDILSVSEFRETLKEALKPPSCGVIFWSWEALEEDFPKKDVIRNVLQEN